MKTARQRVFGSREASRKTWLAIGNALRWAVVSCFFFQSAKGQYYDFTVQNSAEDYLQTVSERVGDATVSKLPRGDALYLAGTFGQLDRFTISPEVFVEHLEGATASRNRFYLDIPEESFRQYILAVRIRSEFTSRAGWRKRLNTELAPLIGEETDVNKAASTVFSWIQTKVKLVGETRTYPLNLKGDLDPLTTLRGGRGGETDVAILAVACLRSIGVAARIVYAPVIANENGGKVWIEYRDSKQWQPWVPSAPQGVNAKAWLQQTFAGKWAYILANPAQPVNITNSYAPATPLWICPHPLEAKKFDASAMVYCNGRLQSVTGRDIYNLEPEKANIGLGTGIYAIVSSDHNTSTGIKLVSLRNSDPGWYQMDFDAKKQQFAEAKEKPAFFEWLPESETSPEPW